MPVSTLVTTAGSANANAYCDVTFADQYNADRPFTPVWLSASADLKTSAILWATHLLDFMWVWTGYATDQIQALQWPRTGMLKPNGWEYVDFHTVPVEIQRATAEYARQLCSSDLTANSDLETLGVTSFKAGSVAFTFKDSIYAKVVPDAVFYHIPPDWGRPRDRNAGIRQLVRA